MQSTAPLVLTNDMKKIYYLVFWVSLFLLLDWGIGFLYHQIIAHSNRLRVKSIRYHHDLQPDFAGTDNWGGFDQAYFTNSLGFRDRVVRNVSLKKETDRRIVFIGDSFAEGVGVAYDSSFIGRIQQALRRSNTEVLNAGVVTYSPRLYYLKMKYWIEQRGLELDELFVIIDNADVQDEIVYDGWTPGFWHYSTTLSLIEKVQTRIKKISTPTITWDEKDYYAEREKWLYEPAILQKWGKRGLSLSIKHLLLLKQLCQVHGIKLGVIVFPRPEQIKRGSLTDSFNSAWKKFCNEQGVKMIDLYPAFIQSTSSKNADSIINRNFIAGDVHWNTSGHEKIATAFLTQYQ